MNKDFARILSLLRKERGLSQKEASDSLGISQALLSHYENGKRECGLDFVVEAANFYRVSCDYLLGRTPDRTGATIAIKDLPADTGNDVIAGSSELLLEKRLIMNSLNVVFGLLMQVGNKMISDYSATIIMAAIYRVVRILHTTDKSNPRSMFTVSPHNYCAISSGVSALCEANALNIARNPRIEPDKKMPVHVSPEKLGDGYPQYAPSLLNLISMVESRLVNGINDSQGLR